MTRTLRREKTPWGLNLGHGGTFGVLTESPRSLITPVVFKIENPTHLITQNILKTVFKLTQRHPEEQ